MNLFTIINLNLLQEAAAVNLLRQKQKHQKKLTGRSRSEEIDMNMLQIFVISFPLCVLRNWL